MTKVTTQASGGIIAYTKYPTLSHPNTYAATSTSINFVQLDFVSGTCGDAGWLLDRGWYRPLVWRTTRESIAWGHLPSN